jgi:hypothetical protein
MMMTRLSMIMAAALVAGTVAAHADERSFPVTGFDRIEVTGSADVRVATGKPVAVSASGSAKALDRLDIHVERNTLVIGTKKGSGWGWNNDGKVTVAVAVPMISAANVAGSADVAVDRVKTGTFESTISGSGNVALPALEADAVRFSVSGSGDIKAAGRCGALKVNVAGSGNVDTSTLRCTTLDTSVAGSGDLDAYATQTASISVAGSGDVRVRGGARCTTTKAGSGSVSCGS